MINIFHCFAIYLAFIMSRHKATIPKQSKEKIDLAISTKKQPINSIQQPCINLNNSIVLINLPKHDNQLIDCFPSSLYESSRKRLKKKHYNHAKDSKISKTNDKKYLETLQSEILNRNAFPNLRSSIPTRSSHRQYANFLEEKLPSRESRKNNNRALALYEIKPDANESIKFMNLKEKYLILKRNSFKSKSTIGQIDRNLHSLFAVADRSTSTPIQYKISKQNEEPFDRYNLKSVTQPKSKQIQAKKSIEMKPFLQAKQSELSSNLSNFIQRKYLKGTVLHYTSQEKTNHFEQKFYSLSTKQNSERFSYPLQEKNNLLDCTPWQTDQIAFD